MINTYALMEGIEKYVVGGAVPGLRRVVWESASRPRTTGDTIFLQRPDALWTEDEALLWRYTAEHELGHEDVVNSAPHWRTIMVEKKKDPKYKDDSLLWKISNLISDHVQEHNRVGCMPGRDEVLLKGRKLFLDGQMKVIKKPTPVSALFVWDTDARRSWNPYLPAYKVPMEVAEEVDRIVREGGVNLTVLKNEQEVFDAAVRIRALFPEEDGEDGDEDCPVVAEHSEDSKDGEEEERDPKPKKKKCKGPATYAPRIPQEMEPMPSYYDANMDGVRSLVRSTSLPAKVRREMMGFKRAKWSTGHKRGRLDVNRLGDVLRNRQDVFKQKEDTYTVNAAVSLLVDCSGSMMRRIRSGGGTLLIDHACASALMLAEALQGIGVTVEIAGFTEHGSEALIHSLWLPFGQRYVKQDVIKKMSNTMSRPSCNTDGENILYAYNRLLRQTESKKFLLVMSDGDPSGYGPNDIGEDMVIGFTKHVIDMIDREKRAKLVGIGIGGHTCDGLYTHSVTIDEHTPMESVLLDVVKKNIIA